MSDYTDNAWEVVAGKTAEIARLTKENERLRNALAGLLALPVGVGELRLLDRGIGTASRNKAWLEAREAWQSTGEGAGV